MKNMFEKLETTVWTVFRICIGISFAVLIVAVLIQVIGRLTGTSPVWTEELTRFALLYVAAFGAGLALKTGDLVNVDVLCEAFGETISRRLRLLSALLTALMCAALLLPAWKFVSIGEFQTSPALALQMSYVHLSVLVLLSGIFLFASFRFVSMLLLKQDGRPDNTQDSN